MPKKSGPYPVTLVAVESQKSENAPRTGGVLKVLFKSKDQFYFARDKDFTPVIEELEKGAVRAFRFTGQKKFNFAVDPLQKRWRNNRTFADIDLTGRIDLPPSTYESTRDPYDSDFNEWSENVGHRKEMKQKLTKMLEDPQIIGQILKDVLIKADGNLNQSGWSRDPTSTRISPDSDQREFLDCCEFLSICEKSSKKHPRSSYGMKHDVESWNRVRRPGNAYVSNRIFIAAMIYMGFAPEEPWPTDSLNVHGLISKKSSPLVNNY